MGYAVLTLVGIFAGTELAYKIWPEKDDPQEDYWNHS